MMERKVTVIVRQRPAETLLAATNQHTKIYEISEGVLCAEVIQRGQSGKNKQFEVTVGGWQSLSASEQWQFLLGS
jgi:hypothetical protein